MSAHPDPMRHVLLAAGFCTTVPNVLGQCGMTTQLTAGWTGGAGCGVYGITVSTTGGTAPFTIALTRSQGVIGTFPGDADGDISFTDHSTWGHVPPAWSMIHVQVTDATGCIAVADDGGGPYLDEVGFNSGVESNVDCATGARAIWIDAFIGSVCPWATIPYTITDNSGIFLTGNALNWTVVGSHRVSPFTLVPGTYSVQMGTWTDCWASDGQQVHECYTTNNQMITIPAVTWNPGDCGANVSIRAALQGTLPSGTLMGDSLRVHGLLPLAEPYSALGYSYTGLNPGASTAQALLNVAGNNAIVDWVIVELRNSANAAQVMFSRPALLQRDGDVIDLDGDNYVNFPNASGSYYVAIRHRNHLGVMTSTTRSLTQTPVVVDLRSASTSCYGTAPRAQVGSVYCLWCGDGNGNGTLAYTGANNDRDPILIAIGGSTPNNAVSNVYDRRDTNLDGVIKYTGANNDRDVILLNVGSTTPNSTRTQQLP